jgi:hypothetical protein
MKYVPIVLALVVGLHQTVTLDDGGGGVAAPDQRAFAYTGEYASLGVLPRPVIVESAQMQESSIVALSGAVLRDVSYVPAKAREAVLTEC